jgi:actin related protein 2/3 complex subunit 1A/1B
MSAITLPRETGPITTHAFNKDKTKVAVVNNSNVVSIYRLSGGKWEIEDSLVQHDKLVTAVDWAPESNRIVTCSQDRNAYVWNLEKGEWKPTLVLLRINRAATFVRWSPLENKFAVASGDKLISICYFEQENDWWVSKHLKKPITSTVLSLDWHPENILLVAGSCDKKTRVFSAWIKGIDAKASHAIWGEKLPFGTICGEFSTNAWVHSVAWSPSGNTIAWVAHDSSLSVVYGPNDPVITVNTGNLPFMTLVFVSENQIIAAGHDCCPMLFTSKAHGVWDYVDKLHQGPKKSVTSGNSAFNKFKQMDSKAQSENNGGTELSTIHQNTIT